MCLLDDFLVQSQKADQYPILQIENRGSVYEAMYTPLIP